MRTKFTVKPRHHVTAAMLCTLLAALLVLTACSTVTTGDESTSTPVGQIVPSRLAIVHTGALQGSFEPDDGRLGLASVVGRAHQLERDGYDVLLLDSGDTLMGTDDLTDGEDAVGLLNAAGYDALALGPTELALGARTFATRSSQSDFALISANATSEDNDLVTSAYTIATLSDGRLVGVFGLSAPTPAATRNLPYAGSVAQGDDAIIACAQDQVAALRKEGCRLVVCLANLGISDLAPTADQLASSVSGIDVVLDVSGLSFGRVAQTDASGEQTLVVTTPAGLKGASVVFWEQGTLSAETLDGTQATASDEQIEALLNQAEQERQEWFGASIASSPVRRAHQIARKREAILGDLVADAALWEGRRAGVRVKPDAALIDAGALAAPLPAGKLTRADVFAICPHADTRLFAMQVSGAHLRDALEDALALGTSEEFPQVAGIELTWRKVKGKREARVEVASVGGRPFSADERYLIVATAHVAAGEGAYASLAPEEVTDLDASAGKALVDYLVRACHGSIDVPYDATQGRITRESAQGKAS